MLIRLAGYLRSSELGIRITRLSYDLVEHIAANNAARALNTANTIKALIILGKNTLVIEPVNAKVLLRETDFIIREMNRFTGLSELPDLETLFSKEVKIERNAAIPTDQDHVGEMRQARIIEIIRQSASGKIQLRDLVAEFPGISERTIRYDLKRLSEENKIERQGSGGPSNFYVLKQNELPSVINL